MTSMNIQFDLVRITRGGAGGSGYDSLVFTVEAPKKLAFENSNDYWLFFKTMGDGGARMMAVNMERLEFIDSSGISVLINAAKLLRNSGGDIVLCCAPPEIRNILGVVHLQNFMKFFTCEAEAVNHFRSS